MSEANTKRRGSAAEHVIRDAVVDRLRVLLPGARIIHELVCGDRRADLAAVEPEWITLIELKSEKDVLDRCEGQMKRFGSTGHDALLVAHEKWFDRSPYTNGAARCVWPDHGYQVWHYPEPAPDHPGHRFYAWAAPSRVGWSRTGLKQPAPRNLLGLLWRAELMDEANAHGIVGISKTPMEAIIDFMAYRMTGQQIARAVCRQLRMRPFPEADAPSKDDPAHD